MMKKQKWRGTDALKSLVAIVTMAAVLVLTLPVFKLDAGAVTGTWFYIGNYDFSEVPFNYSVLMEFGDESPVGFEMCNGDFDVVNSSGTAPAGSVVLLPSATFIQGMMAEMPGSVTFDLDALSRNSTTEDMTLSPIGGVGDQMQITLYTLTSDLSYSINGFTVIITGPSTDTGSSETVPASVPSSPMQQMQAMNWAELLSQLNAYLSAQDAALARQRADYESQQAKIAQANRDNLYFRNLNEAIRNGKSMVVFSDHSALRSQINGTYLANSVPGFAALFMGLPNPNLHIETWNITSKNAPDAVNAINGVAEQNGYTVGAMLQVNIGEKGPDGKPVYESTNKEPVANIVMGVPNSIRGDGAEYGAVQVLPGGEIHMYKDLPFNDNAVSLPLGIGRSAIGLVQTN